MTSPLRIGVIGLGTVGAALVSTLQKNKNFIATRAGRPLVVVAVSARDKTKDRGFDHKDLHWFDDPVTLAKSSDIDCLVELIGGADGTAKAAVETALASGKSVVTANKALLAKHGRALVEIGRAHV